MSEIDYGARTRLDYIEQQLQALFPDSYVPFAKASIPGMPAAVVELCARGQPDRRDQGIPQHDRRRVGRGEESRRSDPVSRARTSHAYNR